MKRKDFIVSTELEKRVEDCCRLQITHGFHLPHVLRISFRRPVGRSFARSLIAWPKINSWIFFSLLSRTASRSCPNIEFGGGAFLLIVWRTSRSLSTLISTSSSSKFFSGFVDLWKVENCNLFSSELSGWCFSMGNNFHKFTTDWIVSIGNLWGFLSNPMTRRNSKTVFNFMLE